MLRVTISKGPPLRRVCWDLETRPLAYWYDGKTTSEITAFGWKWEDEPDVHSLVLTSSGRFNDGSRNLSKMRAYALFVAELASADLIYGHNIRAFDLPVLNAQLIRLQMPVLRPMMTTDTYRDIPKRAELSLSLGNLSVLYDLGAKKGMAQPEWEAANRLTTAGIADARERVSSDVLLQEALLHKLEALQLLKRPRAWRP